MLRVERKALYRFLGVYYASMLLFIALGAFTYYHIQSEAVFDERMSTLQDYKQRIMGSIARNSDQEIESVLARAEYPVLVYDQNHALVYGTTSTTLPLDSFGWHVIDGKGYFISRTPPKLMQRGTMVIIDNQLAQQLRPVLYQTLIATLIAIILMAIISLVLARLFIKPLSQNLKRLDHFIKDATHEMNTPLSAILMSLETLDKSSMDEAGRKKLQRIESGAKGLAHIYDDLIFANFPEKIPFRSEEIALVPFIEQRIAFFEPMTQYKKIRFEAALTPLSVHSDPQRLQRIVDNLLSNAIKYSHRGGVIEIELAKHQLRIQDNGIGIEADMLDKIQERYVRANQDRGGFGIGLSIVSTLCRELGITFELTSQLHKGTLVTLTFPSR